MTETKKSVLQQVKDYAAANPKFTYKSAREALPHITPSQVSTALWKLANMYRTVRRLGDGAYELTDVNNPAPPAPKAKTKAKVKRVAASSRAIKDLQDRLQEANLELISLHKEVKHVTALREAYQRADQDLREAMTLIRYLENKLFIAIQFDAKKNGSDA